MNYVYFQQQKENVIISKIRSLFKLIIFITFHYYRIVNQLDLIITSLYDKIIKLFNYRDKLLRVIEKVKRKDYLLLFEY